MNDKIQAFVMGTDPLNLLQNSNNPLGALLPDVDGRTHRVFPEKTNHYYNGHSIMNFLELKNDPEFK